MAKPKMPIEPPPFDPVTWIDKPTLDEVRGVIADFFAALTASDAPRAFSRMPHHESSKPYMTVPDKTSIKAAVALMRKVLLDHALITKDDHDWAARVTLTDVVPATEYAWYARIALGDTSPPVAGLFNAIKNSEGRWLLAFSMLRRPHLPV